MVKRDRDMLIRFFVTAEEKEIIKQRMALLGLKNMSSYLRKIAMDGYMLNVDFSCFDGICNDINGASRNINQIAKRINSTDKIYSEDIAELHKKQEEIWRLLKSILSQLP